MKRIGLILHPYGEDKPAGLGRAIYEITRSLIEVDTLNHYIVYLRRRPQTMPTFAGNNWEVKILDFSFLWLDRGLFRENLDLCFFNTPIMPLFVKPKKSVIIAYDYAYRYFEKNWKLTLYHRFSLTRADHTVAVSEYTKRETVEHYGISERKVSVIYLGFEHFCKTGERHVRPLASPFFLFVGVIKERKNVLGVVRAFHLFKEKTGLPYRLAVLGWGSGAYFESITAYLKEHALHDDVLIDQASAGDALKPYYQHAEALLYPSFVEGFGFPVLEAMSCGVPVIASNAGSLPEVAGDAALLVDPNDPNDIAKAMERIVSEEGLRGTFIEKGRVQTQKFSWEKTAHAYRSLVRTLT